MEAQKQLLILTRTLLALVDVWSVQGRGRDGSRLLGASVLSSVRDVEDGGVVVGSLHLLHGETSDGVAVSASEVASANSGLL